MPQATFYQWWYQTSVLQMRGIVEYWVTPCRKEKNNWLKYIRKVCVLLILQIRQTRTRQNINIFVSCGTVENSKLSIGAVRRNTGQCVAESLLHPRCSAYGCMNPIFKTEVVSKKLVKLDRHKSYYSQVQQAIYRVKKHRDPKLGILIQSLSLGLFAGLWDWIGRWQVWG